MSNQINQILSTNQNDNKLKLYFAASIRKQTKNNNKTHNNRYKMKEKHERIRHKYTTRKRMQIESVLKQMSVLHGLIVLLLF